MRNTHRQGEGRRLADWLGVHSRDDSRVRQLSLPLFRIEKALTRFLDRLRSEVVGPVKLLANVIQQFEPDLLVLEKVVVIAFDLVLITGFFRLERFDGLFD